MTNHGDRTPTALDAIAEDYAEKLIDLSPELATQLGRDTGQDGFSDYSPDGIARQVELTRSTLEQVNAAETADEVDEVTKAAMQERLGLEIEAADAGELGGEINVLFSPLQNIRDVFDLMPSASAEDWEAIASRMRAIPAALDGYRDAIRATWATRPPALRQVQRCADQADQASTTDASSFSALIRPALENEDLSPALQAELMAAATVARDAYAELSVFLGNEVTPRAVEQDAVGRERYQLASRGFLGATVDLDETYDWGSEELRRIDAEQREIAAELYGPGTSVTEAMERLNADPDWQIHGKDTLRTWMQEKGDDAIAKLAGTHFTIPEPVRTIEAMIAPSGTGGIYYTGPADDFSRPGRMWWSVPAGVDTFNIWQELTTVYHEGVPGHHLQLGMAVYLRNTLNLWRRQLCWVSGHGEGWALYAERLMDELGFLDHPAYRFGMLDSQRLRAARVVLDIGLHLQKPMHSWYGEGIWDYHKAWEFLRENVAMEENFLRFELNRYCGLPGQAPSYKIGQRIWEELRATAQAKAEAAGEEFSLKAFHDKALSLGSVGLDVMRSALN